MAQRNLEIIKILGKNRVKPGEPLAKHTTFGVGGPADLFYEAETKEELVTAVKLARKLKIPFFILGSGSNILVSDKGLRGLVIKNSVSGMKVVKKLKKPKISSQIARARFRTADPQKYLKFSDLNYPDEPLDTEIEVFSGTPLQTLIQWTFKTKLTGLQWFAGIPGTVGGAVIYNIHGGTRLFSNYVLSLEILDKNNQLREIKKADIEFDYDFSDIFKKDFLILKINLLLSRGNLAKAKHVYQEWGKRKRKIQPQGNYPGSIFKNFPEETARKLGAPTPAAGWFIEQCGLKEKKVGKAQISSQHANFIVNLGGATAGDVIQLIELAREEVKKKFGIRLEEEIGLLGFDKI
ncbi:MAG TPA: UDP-N-acetylmuramate dehydrogenase [Candidatus Bathyarchaeia archaeon]|nr:UDP-N-acetylmuramate dehydrogenase [Candidatus Bathyarchaeia archaeon]